MCVWHKLHWDTQEHKSTVVTPQRRDLDTESTEEEVRLVLYMCVWHKLHWDTQEQERTVVTPQRRDSDTESTEEVRLLLCVCGTNSTRTPRTGSWDSTEEGDWH